MALDRTLGRPPTCIELPETYRTSSLSIAVLTKGDFELEVSTAWKTVVLNPVVERAIQRYRNGDPVELAWLVSTLPGAVLYAYPEATGIALRELQEGDGEFVRLVRQRPHKRRDEETLAQHDSVSVKVGPDGVPPEVSVYVHGGTSGQAKASRTEAIAELASAEDRLPVALHRERARNRKEAPAFARIRKRVAEANRAAVMVDVPRVMCLEHFDNPGIHPCIVPTLDWQQLEVANLRDVERGDLLTFRTRTALPIWGNIHVAHITTCAGGIALHSVEAGTAQHAVGALVGAIAPDADTAAMGVVAWPKAECSVPGCRVLVVPPELFGLPPFPCNTPDVLPPLTTKGSVVSPAAAPAASQFGCECGGTIPGPWNLLKKYKCGLCARLYEARLGDNGTIGLVEVPTRPFVE